MNYNEARAEILPRWEEILQRITSPAKKQGEYICLLCGHGAHGDGLKKNPRSTKHGLKCFGACGFSGDILEYLKRAEGLDSFPEQLERASSLLGISLDGPRPTEPKPSSKNKPTKTGTGSTGNGERKPTHTHMNTQTNTYTNTHTHTNIHTQPEEEKDYRAYYKTCSERLEEAEAKAYLASRGISRASVSLRETVLYIHSGKASVTRPAPLLNAAEAVRTGAPAIVLLPLIQRR